MTVEDREENRKCGDSDTTNWSSSAGNGTLWNDGYCGMKT